MLEDLRRIARVSVCCRVVVRDRYGLWTAITDDLCERGCQLVTQRLLRPGTTLQVTLSSDLFPEELDVVGRTVWSAADRLGVAFEGSGDRAGLTPRQFLDRVLEHGEMPDSTSTARLVPSVQRRGGAGPAISTTARNGRLVRTVQTGPGPLRPARRA
jgi:hypothetical protein